MARYKKGWSAAHQKVFKMTAEGYLPGEIAKKLEFGIDKVRNIIRSEKFQENHTAVIKNSVDTARKALEGRLVEAAGQIIRIMKTGKPEERLKFDAAKEILYQCGMKPVEVVETRTRQYTPEEIQSSLTVVKEIQTIEEALAAKSSEFLVKQEADEPLLIPTANVEAVEAVDTIKEEIPVA
jgi:hypothetical protein